MKFTISAFTHIGTGRDINQDRILVGDQVLEAGFILKKNPEVCYCFVADGVGGGVRGEIASRYILTELIVPENNFEIHGLEEINRQLERINSRLLEFSRTHPDYSGTASTLAGLLIDQTGNNVYINVGDSELWAFKKNLMIKISEDQVLDSFDPSSPLVSYFGGYNNSLDLSQTSRLRNLQAGDLYVLASDGLFNSLTTQQVKEILNSDESLEDKSKKILDLSLERGAPDNISCILVEIQ